MWNTTLGCRVLTATEARWVGDAAYRLTDDIRTNMPREGQSGESLAIGVPLFDQMTPEQQIVMINRVIGYLFNPSLDPPPRSALLDATIAAIYTHAYGDVCAEIDSARGDDESEQDDTECRQAVIQALRDKPIEAGEEPQSDFPDPNSDDMEEWEMAIDSLRGCVLPDEDWQMAEFALDLPSDQSAKIKQQLGIDGDYFIDIPPEVTRAEARSAWVNLIARFDHRPLHTWQFGDQELTPVLLSDIVSEMECGIDEWSSYVNVKTGQIVGFPADVFEFIESEQCEEAEDDTYFGDASSEMIEEARQVFNEDYHIELPSQFDIHEWSIMRDFCYTVENDEQQHRLLNAIHGSGAFRFFKATIDQYDLRDEWFAYRTQSLERIAIEWLNHHAIPWVRERS